MASENTRDKLRALTVSKKDEFKSEIVEYEGMEFEIRQPSYEDRQKLYQSCHDENGKLDSLKFLVWAVIRNTFVPGTDERVFENGDYDKLVKKPAGGFVDVFGNKAMELFNVEGKNLESSEETSS